MFLGPFIEGGDYQDQGISGLARLPAPPVGVGWWRVKTRRMRGMTSIPRWNRSFTRRLQRVTEQVGTLRYNTAIAAMMELSQRGRAPGEGRPPGPRSSPWCRLVAPFAPHIAEELWRRLGHEGQHLRGRELARVRSGQGGREGGAGGRAGERAGAGHGVGAGRRGQGRLWWRWRRARRTWRVTLRAMEVRRIDSRAGQAAELRGRAGRGGRGHLRLSKSFKRRKRG